MVFGGITAKGQTLVFNSTITYTNRQNDTSAAVSNVWAGIFNPMVLNGSNGFYSVYVNPSKNFTNLSITVNSLNNPVVEGPNGGGAYTYIMVNSSLGDNYISGAEYVFKVRKNWVNAMGIQPAQVTLFKYLNNTWEPLPTSLVESTSSDYVYMALSDSFSLYTVSYVTGSAAGNVNPTSVKLASGYKSYFCAAGANYTFAATSAISWIADQNATDASGTGASVGHQSSNTCSANAGGTALGLAVVGIGANVVRYTAYKAAANSATSLALTYTVSTANSFTVIIGAAGYYDATAFKFPSSCTKQRWINNTDTYESAFAAICASQAAGSYKTNATLASAGAGALAAYVFPPANVVFDDNPTTGKITTGGITFTNGQSALLLGSNTITANTPSGYTFNSWSVSNSVNLTIANTLAASTTLTVIGNGIVTANFNSNSGTCSVSLSPNTINFGTINPGSSIATANSITDTNSGTSAAYMFAYGSSWSTGSHSFGITNTSWAGSSGVAYSTANKLTATPTNTLRLVPASGSNTIYFGLNIPSNALASTYQQTITIENSC